MDRRPAGSALTRDPAQLRAVLFGLEMPYTPRALFGLHSSTPLAPLASFMSVLSVVAVMSAMGCQPEIGDPCKRSLDCGLQVIRQCDISNAARDPEGEGECVLENCSYGTCPKEAVCIKVYASEFLSQACDPAQEDLPDAEGTITRDDCQPSEVCLPEGLCADELRARTSCRRQCKSDGDCRDNYECKRTGFNGVYVSPNPNHPTVIPSDQICVPR